MIRFNNGIEVSEETVMLALKKAGFDITLGEPKQVKVHNFRATKMVGVSYPYYLGGVKYHGFTTIAKKDYNNMDAHIASYTKTEVEQIIAGLQDLLKA